MTTTTRVQLTLFIPPPVADRVEAVRRVVDPVQFALIPAHVTLCREDELAGMDLARLQDRLQAAAHVRALTLTFSAAEAFDTHGILLPCVSGKDAFQALREAILRSSAIRLQRPHLTLAHPRNPKAPGNSLAKAQSLGNDLEVRFTSVAVIRQDGGEPWQVLHDTPLAAAELGDA